MAYISGAFVEFREIVQRNVKELESVYPERYSIEWFFLRYTQRVAKRALKGESPRDSNGAMRGLTRFYVDMVANESSLSARFEEVLESHRNALRLERPE
jgi:hypothetical protein